MLVKRPVRLDGCARTLTKSFEREDEPLGWGGRLLVVARAFRGHDIGLAPGRSIWRNRSAASSGSFTTTATATDTKSGIASYSFPSLGTNWTSTPGALGVNTYSWSGAPAVPGSKSVTATNNATVVSGGTSFTLTADNTAPTAGTVNPPNAIQASTSVIVAYSTGTDGGSGLGTRLLQRQSATLAGSTCGSYSGWTTAATNPASSAFSDTVTAGFCYRYQYVVADKVGNTTTATSGNVVKVTLATTVKAQYKNKDSVGPADNSIKPGLQLVNNGSSGVDLSTITVRYWFTKDGASPLATPTCYWAAIDCTNVKLSQGAVVHARTGADVYVEVGFKPVTLAGDGAQSGDIQLGINKTDWTNFDETDDYSYGAGTTYTDWTRATVYQNDILIWGTEP